MCKAALRFSPEPPETFHVNLFDNMHIKTCRFMVWMLQFFRWRVRGGTCATRLDGAAPGHTPAIPAAGGPKGGRPLYI
jgi:hypothetical protein